MNGDIIPFSFEGAAVRVHVDDAGQPWFNCSDVCAALEFGNPRQAVESHVDADDVQKLDAIDGLGRTQLANHVNESGVYSLILGSTKAKAKRFKRWVTSEVLPSIRKTGTYSLGRGEPVAPVYILPPSYSEALRALADEHEAHTQTKQVAHEQRVILEEQAPVVAAHKRLMTAHGLFGIRECAKQLKVESHAEFVSFLELGVLYRTGKRRRLIAYKDHENAKRVEVSSGVTDGGEAWAQTRFTAKGLAWLAGRWGEYQLDPEAYRSRHAKAKRTDESGSNEAAA